MSRGAAKAKHGHRDRGAAPQPAQVDAVRRLAAGGRYEEASSRLAELRARFPAFKPLLALAWEVEWKAGSPIAACARAWDWTQASPGSRAALEALTDSAKEAGLFALATQTLMRLRVLDGQPLAEPEPEIGPFGKLSLEQAARLDLGRVFLSDARFDAAQEAFAHIEHPAARNNLALTLQSKGDIDGALAAFEGSWQGEPRNLFALEWAIRLRLWRHGRDRAAGLIAPLRGTPPVRSEDAYAQIAGLVLLGAHADADAAWRAAEGAGYWSAGGANDALLRTRFDYLGGIAAHRLGQDDEAERRFRLASDADAAYAPPTFARFALATPAISGGVSAEVGDFATWFPSSWVGRITALKADTAAIEDFLRRCDATAEYLGLAAEFGGEGPRRMALEILKLRARAGDAAAAAELKSLLARPCGPDRERSRLHAWLTESGLLQQGETTRLLTGGEVRDIQGMNVRITAEPEEVDYTPAESELNESLHAALRDNKLAKALDLARRFLALRPRDPRALGYVATVKEALGHPPEEWEALYRQALEIDPEYLFAKMGLAKAHARRGEVEAARELLGTVLGRPEYHYSEWRSILLAQVALAKATEDYGAVLRINEAIAQLQEQFA
jgi:hypothetical protein